MEPRYYHHVIGGNFRLDEIQAAILELKLLSLTGWSSRRREIADSYRELFEQAGLTEHLSLPAEPYRDKVNSHHIYHQYVIRAKSRDALREYLSAKGVGTAIYYPLGLHRQPAFAYLNLPAASYPQTDAAAAETLALPIFPALSGEAQTYVVDSITSFFKSPA